MCNRYRNTVDPDRLKEEFSQTRIELRFPEGIPNFRPGDVAITDTAPIIRANGEAAELIQRRWSWPGPSGKPVYNFRSEGRRFGPERCLIVTDGFYEYTANPGSKLKHQWLFTKVDEPIFCIAGIYRKSEAVGEAFTMLTTEPGPDVKPYHHRQIVVLDREDWGHWLFGTKPEADLLRPLRGGSLAVEQVR
jgi:putative SOS response-associated peptidase YedK